MWIGFGQFYAINVDLVLAFGFGAGNWFCGLKFERVCTYDRWRTFIKSVNGINAGLRT